jgi:GT2 family glycosyltransferase
MMTQAVADVSVIIVSWNTRELLTNCLRSVFNESPALSLEVIVIDNASRDGTPEMIRSEFPEVKLIVNSENRGFAAANNQGFRIGVGRYMLMLNPDTEVWDGAIKTSIDYAEAHPDVGIVGCQVYLSETEIQRTGMAFPSAWNLALTMSGLSRAFSRSRLFGAPELGWWDRKDERDLDVISGMFMLIRRAALDQVGLLDEAYFVYAEETDLCFRFSRAGWRRVFIPTARILHVDGGSKCTGQVSVKMFVQLQKSLMIYFAKNTGTASWLAAKALYVIFDSVKAASWWALSLSKGDALLKSKARAAVAALRFHVFGIDPA